jgi:hypothetical protein
MLADASFGVFLGQTGPVVMIVAPFAAAMTADLSCRTGVGTGVHLGPLTASAAGGQTGMTMALAGRTEALTGQHHQVRRNPRKGSPPLA